MGMKTERWDFAGESVFQAAIDFVVETMGMKTERWWVCAGESFCTTRGKHGKPERW